MSFTSLWVAFSLALFLDLLISIIRSCLTQSSQARLFELREKHPAQVDRTVQLLARPSLRITLRLAMLVMHFLLAGIAWLLLEKAVVSVSLTLALLYLVAAALALLVVELLIERAAGHNSETCALRLTPFGSLLDILLRPFAWVLLKVYTPGVLQRNFNTVTEDELKTWLVDTQPSDTLETGEKKMIFSIFQFGDTICREIMVPRIDVMALEVACTPEEAIRSILQAGHSRVPVYEENIDNIIGLLYAKDLLRQQMDGGESLTIRSLLRPVYFVPEAKKVDELLREMRQKRMHMAVIIDEYGGMAGLVTLEDILEEIIGEIRDEYDQGEEGLYELISPDEYLFSGRIYLGDLNDLLDTHLNKESADTLGGFIYSELGRVPFEGDQVQADGWTLTVQKVSRRRITKVLAHRNELVENKKDEEEEKDASAR